MGERPFFDQQHMPTQRDFELARIRLRSARISAREGFRDLLSLAWPVFAVIGLVAVSARFWLWILDFGSVACSM